MPLNIRLIGAGRMGSTLAYHLAFVVDSANLVAIADTYEDNARKTAAKCNSPTAIATTRSLDEGRPIMLAKFGV